MYHQEAAGSRRDSASAAAASPASVRRYQLVSSGEIAEMNDPDAMSRISVPCSWQQQEYEPSTIVNVKIVGDMSPTASITNSASVRRSSNQQYEGDVHRRIGTMPYHEIPNPVQFGNRLQRQLTSATECCPSAMGRRSERAEHSSEIPAIPASSKQVMINARLIPASDRESVLQKLNEELHQQQMSWKTDHPLSSVRTHADSLKQSVVKPVPVKAQPYMQRFHPLMASPPQVPSSTVVPLAAQTASSQSALSVFYSASGKRTENSSNFGSLKRSPSSCQPNVHNSQLSLPCSSDARNPYLSVGISQSVQYGSPVPSSIGRWHPEPGKESLYSPGRLSSSLGSDTQHTSVASLPTALGSPVQQYGSQQHGVSSPIHYGSSMYPCLLPQSLRSPTLLHAMQSANLVSPRHNSPEQYIRVSSPAASFPPVYPQGSYSAVRPAVYSPSPVHSSSTVNQPPPSTTFSSPNCCSAMSPTTLSNTDRSASLLGSGVGSEVSFAASCSLPRSATALRHYRVAAPATSVVPPLSYTRKQYYSVPHEKQPKQQSVLPPACLPRRSSKNPRPTLSQQRSGLADVDGFRLPPTGERAQVNVCKTVDKPSHAQLTSMVSPSKFFQRGSLDFDSYIGKLVPVLQNRLVMELEGSASTVTTEATKPDKKQPLPVQSAVKRKLQWTEPQTKMETEIKMETESKTEYRCRFADKFQESVSFQGLIDTAEGDSTGNKWSSVLAVEKQSKVCIYVSFATSLIVVVGICVCVCVCPP